MNTEELKARIAELEQQNADLEAKVAELTADLESANGSNDYLRKQNTKFHKSMVGIKSLAELMLP